MEIYKLGKAFKSLGSVYCFSGTDTASVLSMFFPESPERFLFIGYSIFRKDCLLPRVWRTMRYKNHRNASARSDQHLCKCSECFIKLLHARLKMCITTTPITHLPKYTALQSNSWWLYSSVGVLCLLKHVIISGFLTCQPLCRVFLF